MNQFAADPLFNKTLQAFDSDSLKSLFLNVFEVTFKLFRLVQIYKLFFLISLRDLIARDLIARKWILKHNLILHN